MEARKVCEDFALRRKVRGVGSPTRSRFYCGPRGRLAACGAPCGSGFETRYRKG